MEAKKIKNPVARMWTKTELNQTVKQSRAAGLEVERDGDTTKITDPNNGNIVLMSLYTGRLEMVRIDKSYFE
jgi:hypothetical protein